MGNCFSVDRLTVANMQQFDRLASENLILLKAIILSCIENNNQATAVRIIKIRSITKKYYKSVSVQRKKVFQSKKYMEETDIQLAEGTLKCDYENLTMARHSLESAFSSMHSSIFYNSPRQYIEQFKHDEKVVNKYQIVKSKVQEYLLSGRDMISLSAAFNQNKELDKNSQEMLKAISEHTSHVATNPSKRISYTDGLVKNVQLQKYPIRVYDNVNKLADEF